MVFLLYNSISVVFGIAVQCILTIILYWSCHQAKLKLSVLKKKLKKISKFQAQMPHPLRKKYMQKGTLTSQSHYTDKTCIL